MSRTESIEYNTGTMVKITTLLFCLLLIGFSGTAAVYNHKVGGYAKPQVCLESNIRCILKKQGNHLYWCLKSNHQRSLDARRTTSPIKKTRREVLGHCAQMIPIREEANQE
ncbi:MAG: hypothetical protein HOE30_20820 [Deltaproteobacteria bacterium]|nr:hypothetical protein [Deltaproteobacteria bacterium]MBT4090937.1 hypothetical protein [Deltaproteobacteria bacterium]MBT4641304.1 hypothetical protein [Deltaproteobacteria bacterium]